MSQTAPLVSLCIPTYRRAAFIGETLESALQQTVTDFEVIVVDDASPDNTAEVVASYADSRIQYYRNEHNLGVPENLNYALSLARGEFVMLLEDHDLLVPTYLEETLRVMRRYPSVGFVATGFFTIDEQSCVIGRWPPARFAEFTPGHKLLRNLLINTACPFSLITLIRRLATIELAPLFDAKYWWYADQHLWMRMAAQGDFGYVPKLLVSYRLREADHALNDRFWQSNLVLSRIHRDNWHLLYPTNTIGSRLDWVHYEWAKLLIAGGMRAGRMLRNESWTQTDDTAAREYLAPIGYHLLGMMRFMPLSLINFARRQFHAHDQRVRRIYDFE